LLIFSLKIQENENEHFYENWSILFDTIGKPLMRRVLGLRPTEPSRKSLRSLL
jgi:hypothetical protein